MVHRSTQEIIGSTTANDVKIKNYIPHFTARVFGSVEQRRNGVELDDVVDALTNKKTYIRTIQTRNGKASQTFSNGKVDVTVNPETGMLVQTNPSKRKINK